MNQTWIASLFSNRAIRSLFFFICVFSAVNSKHIFYIKCCWGLDSNWRPLVPEATTFPIEQDCIAQYQVTLSQVKCYINEKEKIKFLKYFGLFNKVKTSRNEKCEFLQKENIFENLLLWTELFWGVAKICLLLPNSMLQRPSSAFEMGIHFIFTLTVRLKYHTPAFYDRLKLSQVKYSFRAK